MWLRWSVVGVRISFGIAERIVQVDAPRNIRIGIIQPSSRNIFIRDRMVIYPSVVVGGILPRGATGPVIAIDRSLAGQ